MANITKSFSLDVQVMALGDGFIALSSPGGVRVRSAKLPSEEEATKNLFTVIANGAGDSDIALTLMINGTTIEEELGAPALGASTEQA